MATSEENLVFGDFEDLSAEESQYIHHILYGQKKQFTNKVEFPWDAGSEELQGAVGGTTYGSQSWICDVENYEGNQNIVFQGMDYMKDSDYNLSFNYTEMPPAMTQQEANDPNTPSKLQASLKPYERRNKKKRPPDYYNRQSAEREEPMDNQSDPSFTQNTEPVQPMMTGYQSQMLPGQQNSVPVVQNTNIEAGMMINKPVQMQPTNYNISVQSNCRTAPNFMNTAYNANIPMENRQDYQNNTELCEVVVEPCPQKPVKILARPETYEVQDHDRTISVNMPSDNKMDVDNNRPIIPIAPKQAVIPINNPDISNMSNVSTGEATPAVLNAASATKTPSVESSSQNQGSVYSSVSSDKILHPCLEKDIVMAGDNKVDISSETHTNSGMYEGSQAQSDSAQMSDTASVGSAAPSDVSIDAPKPKPKSWAGLFKGAAPSYTPEIQDAVMMKPADTTDRVVADDERNEKEYSPLPVPAAEDSNAKQLGDLLSKMCISHSSVALQPRGLINRGNWCYINGTLQALVACPPFYNLLKKMPRYPALSRGPSSTPILDALVEFVHEFQPMSRTDKERGKNKVTKDITPGVPFEPSYVYKMLQTIAVNPHFKLGKQEDAEEFLSCILDGMHEEISAVVNHSKPDMEVCPAPLAGEDERYTNGFVHAEDGDEETDEEEQWEQVGPKKKSVPTRRPNFAKTPIADIFAGMVRSAVYKEKSKETATLEPFFTLQLDIQSEKVWTVNDALSGLVSHEPISGYTCPKTNTELEVTKRLTLEELPPVLILHLKFFVYNKDGGSQKLMKRVDYPVELEIKKDLLSPSAKNKLREQQRTYKLFAVVYHHGKAATGGHYTTSVFHPGINGWVHSDDSSVKTVTVAQVLKYQPQRVPYILYYRRLDSH